MFTISREISVYNGWYVLMKKLKSKSQDIVSIVSVGIPGFPLSRQYDIYQLHNWQGIWQWWFIYIKTKEHSGAFPCGVACILFSSGEVKMGMLELFSCIIFFFAIIFLTTCSVWASTQFRHFLTHIKHNTKSDSQQKALLQCHIQTVLIG